MGVQVRDATVMGVRMNKEKSLDRCTFNFVLASELRKEGAPALYDTPFQKINPEMLIRREITMREVIEGSLQGKILVVSHRWCRPGAPDPDGTQEKEIVQYLKEHPEVEFVWHDVSATGQQADSHALTPWSLHLTRGVCLDSRVSVLVLAAVAAHRVGG